MTRRLSPVLAAALAAAAAVPTAAAAASFVALPSPTSAFRPTPPVQGIGSATTERRIPGRIAARTLVTAAVAKNGEVAELSALNRLLLHGTGDYTFAVAAPADTATRGPGSASAPGLRRGGVLWQGFAVKRRLLVARIRLARAAAPSLPLRISIGSGAVELANTTTARTSVEAAPAAARTVAARLDQAHAAVAQGLASASLTVPRTGPLHTAAVSVTAPLRLRGVYRFGSGPPRKLSATLGVRPVRLTGRGELSRLDLTATPAAAATLLRPPVGRTWSGYAARGGLKRNPVSFAALRLLRAALATQYQSFLANPDSFGPSATTYRFILTSASADALPSPKDGEGGTRRWLWALAGLGLLAAAAGGVVAWAHS